MAESSIRPPGKTGNYLQRSIRRDRNQHRPYTEDQEIIDQVEDQSRVGVCIDTCHSYSAGYDIKTHQGAEEVFSRFGEIIGFSYLKGMHLNETKKELGSKVDRHDVLQNGLLGMDIFDFIMNDARFDGIPLILETPDETRWAGDIELLRSLIR